MRYLLILAVFSLSAPAHAQNVWPRTAVGFARGFEQGLQNQGYPMPDNRNSYPSNADKRIQLLQMQQEMRIQQQNADSFRTWAEQQPQTTTGVPLRDIYGDEIR